jgi:hypothetical protein
MTCREFLGIARGWCTREAAVWLDNIGFCGHHAVERQRAMRLRGVA